MRRPPKHAAPGGQRRARTESWAEPAARPDQHSRPVTVAGPEQQNWPATAPGPPRGGHQAGRRSADEWPAREDADAAAWWRRQATLVHPDEPGDLTATDGVPPWDLRNGSILSRPGQQATADVAVAEPAADLAVAGPAADLAVAGPAVDLEVAEPAADLGVAEPGADLGVAEPAADPAVAEPAADVGAAPAPPDRPAATQAADGQQPPPVRASWQNWRLSRPFWGAAVTVAASAELALTGGIVGWLSSAGHAKPVLLLAVGLVLCALLLCFHPVWRSAYSTAVVLLAVIALMTDHVGGYLAGSLLAAVGGAIAFAWVPARGAAETRPDGPQSAADEWPTAAGTWPDVPGQVPELTLIRGDAISLPGLRPLSQRPASAPASVFGVGTPADE